MKRPPTFRMVLALLFLLSGTASRASADDALVEITVREKGSGKLLPCRIHVKDSTGQAKRAGDLPFWFDHFVSPGTARVELTAGKYTTRARVQGRRGGRDQAQARGTADDTGPGAIRGNS